MAWLENKVVELLIHLLEVMLTRSDREKKLALYLIRKLSDVKMASNKFYKVKPLYRLLDTPHRISEAVSVEFQKTVSFLSDLPRCEYCSWVVYPDQPHTVCDDELSGRNRFEDPDLDLPACEFCTWPIYPNDPHDYCDERLGERSLQDLDTYGNIDDLMEVYDLSGWDQPKQVWFTEPTAGHYGWE
jgi:hypothetical protein